MIFNYHIGEQYKYPEGDKRFKLSGSNGTSFFFQCGHWCTDNVFVDLIRVKTGVQVYRDNQLEIFN